MPYNFDSFHTNNYSRISSSEVQATLRYYCSFLCVSILLDVGRPSISGQNEARSSTREFKQLIHDNFNALNASFVS